MGGRVVDLPFRKLFVLAAIVGVVAGASIYVGVTLKADHDALGPGAQLFC